MKGSERTTALVDIVIRGKNGHEKTERAIRSIRENTKPEWYRIVLVDDGSDPAYFETLPDVGDLLVAYPDSAGAVTATNRGFAIALDLDAPFVMVMDNDAWIPDGDATWLTRFVEEILEDERIGAVGATTGRANPPQHILTTPDTYSADWKADDGRSGGTNTNPAVASLVSFACLIRKDVLRQVDGGRWDTRYDPGNYEDTDFAVTIRTLGYSVRVARSVYLHHDGHATFGPGVHAIVAKNRKRFTEKWGVGRLVDLGIIKPGEFAEACAKASSSTVIGATR